MPPVTARSSTKEVAPSSTTGGSAKPPDRLAVVPRRQHVARGGENVSEGHAPSAAQLKAPRDPTRSSVLLLTSLSFIVAVLTTITISISLSANFSSPFASRNATSTWRCIRAHSLPIFRYRRRRRLIFIRNRAEVIETLAFRRPPTFWRQRRY